jgi:hypothetical protein
MKKPWTAFALSLLIPGAGLLYLGRRMSGLINFFLVQAIYLTAALGPLDDALQKHFHYIVLACQAASAGIAHATAIQLNRKVAHDQAADAESAGRPSAPFDGEQ